MDGNQDLEEVQCDLDKPGIAVYKKNWTVLQNTVYWCMLKLAQRKGLQFYQIRSHAIALFNTQLANCFEKVAYMKTGEDFSCKVRQSPRLPRVALTPHSQHGRQDPPNPDGSKTTDHRSEPRVCWTFVAHLEDTRRKHPEESQRWRYRENCDGNVPSRKKTRIARKTSKD